MAWFQNLAATNSSEKKYIPVDVRDAYASVLYCCANADKEISDEELISLDNSFMNLPVFEDHDEAEYLKLAEKNATIFTPSEIFDGAFNYIKPSHRPQLYCYCWDIFLADGTITEEEKQALERIAEISGIGEETVKKITEVALLRNVKDE
jgi:uncharacterized tellurite resistance protein B-like protein